MCNNLEMVSEVAPCGERVVYCKNCTAFYDQMACAYHCAHSTVCHCGLENCLQCVNYEED